MNVSVNGRTCIGRWYKKPDRYVIFINKIADHFNPEYEFEEFISEFLATEFHELGHIYGFRSGCRTSLCKRRVCYWCLYTDIMYMWFLHGKFYKDFKFYIRDKVDEINAYRKLFDEHRK
jgi:hypothetical protein